MLRMKEWLIAQHSVVSVSLSEGATACSIGVLFSDKKKRWCGQEEKVV